MSAPRDATRLEARIREVLRDGPRTALEVAERLWPRSPGFVRPNGRGLQGLARAASRHLHALRRRGAVDRELGPGAATWRLIDRCG